jgi:hypothetical protein
MHHESVIAQLCEIDGAISRTTHGNFADMEPGFGARFDFHSHDQANLLHLFLSTTYTRPAAEEILNIIRATDGRPYRERALALHEKKVPALRAMFIMMIVRDFQMASLDPSSLIDP